jgi:hypothetical protein
LGQRGGVGINASIIGDNPTGLGLYAINLIRSLDAIRDDLRVFTSCLDALGGLRARLLSATRLTRPERGMLGHLSRLIWVQTALRLRARRAGITALLNTVPEAILGSPVPRSPSCTICCRCIFLGIRAAYASGRWCRGSSGAADHRGGLDPVDVSRLRDRARADPVIYPGYDPDTYRVSRTPRATSQAGQVCVRGQSPPT